MIPRHLTSRLQRAVEQYPVVSITGPRQSGKTTLAKLALPAYGYVNLESPDQRRLAKEDPRGFLAGLPAQVVIDEAQHVPELFSYIQGIVDQRDEPGQFVLTGSQNFLLHRGISQSLAGRCDILHLLPFSRTELAGEPLASIEDIVARDIPANPLTNDRLMDVLFTGGYPRVHDKQLLPQEWLANYYQTYVERDVRELLNVGDLETFGRFMGLCAGRTGQLLNLSSLANDCGITHTTARRWLSVLETSFLIMLLRPHHRNFNKRMIKSPKLYFLDSGLLCYLLRLRSPDDLIIHASRGAVFESWVISEAMKSYVHRGVRADMFFWRDSTGHEIDLLVEAGGDRLLPIEAKSGQTFSSDFVKELNWWKDLANQPKTPSTVVYGGDESITYKGNHILSWRHWV